MVRELSRSRDPRSIRSPMAATVGRGAGATDATAATDAARSPRNFCRTPSSHSERFSSDSESAVRPPTLRTPGRNTSDSEKTTLGLRENNPRTPRKQPSDSEKTTLGLTDSEKTTLGLTDSEKTILGLREDNPRTPKRQSSDSEKTTLGLREDNPRTPRKQPSD